MRMIKGLWIFYKKLIIPSLALSILLALFGASIVRISIGIGISYIIFTPVVHYFTYEVNNINEYYFYHNLGLSKLFLWVNTVITSLIIGVAFLCL
ncbi:hypothetical protein AY601_1974 [Pedobacter cryoconitis]|uniref:Uncharacterized protein n=1 Tax=Pedobacter cryoconitis TaxID=188932 RepID=A0A127VCD9_9SPHI|nr:hypothetical protein AY601_1974 [Pedobacter cryoconitis]